MSPPACMKTVSSFWMLPGCARVVTYAAAPTSSFSVSWLHIWLTILLNNASVPKHLFFWLFLWEPKNPPHPPVLFFNHHSASGRLPSRKGSPLPGLPSNPSAACPSALHAAHSPVCPPRATQLLVTLFLCAVETSNITASLCLHVLPK